MSNEQREWPEWEVAFWEAMADTQPSYMRKLYTEHARRLRPLALVEREMDENGNQVVRFTSEAPTPPR